MTVCFHVIMLITEPVSDPWSQQEIPVACVVISEQEHFKFVTKILLKEGVIVLPLIFVPGIETPDPFFKLLE